ncbi:MAG TPA: T9SS type A sorting domain-containing protein [Bacteroidia bacterium]|nr:T9SS type A sorting domain-containing protein [Bacteroidia bacterium]
MKIIRIVFCSLFIISCIKIKAQQNIVSTGGDISGAGGGVSYSIGQIDYSTSNGSGGNLSEGVQQPYVISITTGMSITNIQLNFLVYPNPTISNVVLSVDQTNLIGTSYQLLNIEGKLISENKISESMTTIPMENLNASIYIIKIIKNNSEIKTFKVIKN